jgi:hypothetical protein
MDKGTEGRSKGAHMDRGTEGRSKGAHMDRGTEGRSKGNGHSLHTWIKKTHATDTTVEKARWLK